MVTPCLTQAVKDGPEIAARHGVDTGRRLVQQQHLRRMDQCADQPQLLLHPAGKLTGETTAERQQSGGFQQLRTTGTAHCPGDAEQHGIKVDVFGDGQVFVEPEALGHVAEIGSCRLGIGHDVDASQSDRPRIRLKHTREHAHNRALSRPVRADEPENLTLGDSEVDPPHCDHRPEAPGQTMGGDRNRTGHLPDGSTAILAAGRHPRQQFMRRIIDIDADPH